MSNLITEAEDIFKDLHEAAEGASDRALVLAVARTIFHTQSRNDLLVEIKAAKYAEEAAAITNDVAQVVTTDATAEVSAPATPVEDGSTAAPPVDVNPVG